MDGTDSPQGPTSRGFDDKGDFTSPRSQSKDDPLLAAYPAGGTDIDGVQAPTQAGSLQSQTPGTGYAPWQSPGSVYGPGGPVDPNDARRRQQGAGGPTGAGGPAGAGGKGPGTFAAGGIPPVGAAAVLGGVAAENIKQEIKVSL